MKKEQRKDKSMKYVYKVYHGWAFPEYVTQFTSLKKAIAFIEAQKDSDCWCCERVRK